MWCVYIIQCKDRRLYTGITNSLDRRLAEHNSGHGSRFTKFRTPVKLVYCQEVATRSDSLKREAEIKKLNRSEKLALIRSFAPSGAQDNFSHSSKLIQSGQPTLTL